jgi:HAD superfamily hydrolase (TIGR01549 family)
VFKNILWDVDGALFDTYPAITYALSKALNGMGQSVALNVIDGLARESLGHCIDTLSQRFKLDPDLLHARFSESYRKVDSANQSPFPGVREMCEFVHERGGLNIAVTHRSTQSTQMLLDAHGLAPYFTKVFGVEQGDLRKPDPQIIKAALDEHALNPNETLLIGDHELDIQAGRAANVRTILFGRAELKTSADFQIERYSQLLSRLKEASS